MNKIVDTFVMNEDKFMPELHIKQPGYPYSAFGPFNKHCKRIQKAGDLKHLYRNGLDKACFAHDDAYCDTKDLGKIAISGKV